MAQAQVEVEKEKTGPKRRFCYRQENSSPGSSSFSYMGEVEKPISDTELLRIMECPVCNEFPAPPIYCCEKGHFTCTSCMELLDFCSLCKAPFTDVRNFPLESIIENSNFKCRNAHLGCAVVIKGASLNHHVSNCMFRSLDCMEPDCLRKDLSPDDFLQHMMDNHKVIGCVEKSTNGNATVIIQQTKDLEAYQPFSIKLLLPSKSEEVTFLVFSKRHRTFMCWWACCLQPENISKYSVIISLSQEKEAQNLAVQWTLPLQPVWRSFDEIRDTGNCAVLPDTHLAPFYVDEDSWQLKVDVIKKEPIPSNSCHHYLPLLLLFVIGILAVAFTLYFETGRTWSYSMKACKDFFRKYNVDGDDSFYETTEEYVGYRGFYYRTYN